MARQHVGPDELLAFALDREALRPLAGDLGGYEDEARSIYAGGLTEEAPGEETVAE